MIAIQQQHRGEGISEDRLAQCFTWPASTWASRTPQRNALSGTQRPMDIGVLESAWLSTRRFDDDRAGTILRHCRKAMADSARLLLIEWVIPTADEAPDRYRFWDTASMDLIMLAIGGGGGGRVRTAGEFRELLETAGFALKQVISTGSAVRVIEALPE